MSGIFSDPDTGHSRHHKPHPRPEPKPEVPPAPEPEPAPPDAPPTVPDASARQRRGRGRGGGLTTVPTQPLYGYRDATFLGLRWTFAVHRTRRWGLSLVCVAFPSTSAVCYSLQFGPFLGLAVTDKAED